MKMKRILSLHILTCAVLTVMAQSPVKTDWAEDVMTVAFPLTEDNSNGKSYSVWTTPALVSGQGDTIRLDPMVFRGSRNKRYTERGRFFGTAPQASSQEYSTGDTAFVSRTFHRKDYPWLWHEPVRVTALREKEGCCHVTDLSEKPVGRFAYVPTFSPALAAVPDNAGKAGEWAKRYPVLQHISQYRPYDSSYILRKEKGSLFVHFPLGKSELRHDFRDNARTLDAIADITRDIMSDTTSSVKKIQIIGLSSVEGPVLLNQKLSQARAQALKDYVQQRVNTPDSLYELVSGGEAWTELESQIEDLEDIPAREKLLDIIRSEKNPDRRELLVKRLDGGKPYAYLRDNVLRDQRNSGYVHIYYDYVPDRTAQTINQATRLLQREKYEEALLLLQNVKNDNRAQNALGVALYMTGRQQEAKECFRQAAANGNTEAQDNLAQIGQIEKAKAFEQ